MKYLLTFFAAIAITPLSAQAQAPAPASPVVYADNKADMLASIVLPKDDLIAARMPEFEEVHAAELRMDEELVQLEKSHPGIIDAATKVTRDEGLKSYSEAISLLQTDAAKLYASKLNSEELTVLIAFFSKPVGQAMIAISAQSSGISASALEKERREKLLAYIQNPDEQAKADLTTLLNSGLLPKIQSITLEISALSARRFNDVNTIFESRLPDRIEALIAEYTKKPKP
jgi:hypothetical protein